MPTKVSRCSSCLSFGLELSWLFSVLMSLKKAPLSLAELVGVRLSFSVTQFFRFAPAMGFTISVTIVFIADVKFVVAAFQLPCKQQRYDAKRYCNVDSDVRIATFCLFKDNVDSNLSFREFCVILSTMR